MRTTINIDDPILEELKTLQAQEKKPMGRMVSDLLATALATREKAGKPARPAWLSRPMHARVNLEDKEALHAALDAEKRAS